MDDEPLHELVRRLRGESDDDDDYESVELPDPPEVVLEVEEPPVYEATEVPVPDYNYEPFVYEPAEPVVVDTERYVTKALIVGWLVVLALLWPPWSTALAVVVAIALRVRTPHT